MDDAACLNTQHVIVVETCSRLRTCPCSSGLTSDEDEAYTSEVICSTEPAFVNRRQRSYFLVRRFHFLFLEEVGDFTYFSSVPGASVLFNRLRGGATILNGTALPLDNVGYRRR